MDLAAAAAVVPYTEFSFDGFQGTCHICNNFKGVVLTSPQLKQQHMEGAKHRKQLNNWLQLRESMEKSTPVSRDISQNITGRAVPSSTASCGVTRADLTSVLSNLKVGSIMSNSPNNAEPYAASIGAFQPPAAEALRNTRPYKPAPTFPPPLFEVGASSTPTDQDLIEYLDPMCDQYRCHLCEGGKIISGRENLKQHLDGRKHQNSLKQQKGVGMLGTVSVPLQRFGMDPQPCRNPSLTAPGSFVQPPVLTTAVTSAAVQPRATDSRNPGHLINTTTTVAREPDGRDYEVIDQLKCQYRCKPCQIPISGDINLEQHLLGIKHKKLKARLATPSDSSTGASPQTQLRMNSGSSNAVGIAPPPSTIEKVASGYNRTNSSTLRLDDFELTGLLGKGGYGVVFKVLHKLDKQEYALKRTCVNYRSDRQKTRSGASHSAEEERVLREVRALARLRHPHIVTYHHTWFGKATEQEELKASSSSCSLEIDFRNSSTSDGNLGSVRSSRTKSSTGSDSISSTYWSPETGAYENPSPGSYLYIQMELCQPYTLANCLFDQDRANKKYLLPLLQYFQQIVEAVDYLHCSGFIHRDLKPSNILFAEDKTTKASNQEPQAWTVKVGDFGLAKEDGSELENTLLTSISPSRRNEHTAGVGTPLYKSPEQGNTHYDNKVDIYALGLIFVQVLCTFQTDSQTKKVLHSLRNEPTYQKIKETLPSDHFRYLKLVTALLSHNPTDRPSSSKLLESLRLMNPSDGADQLKSCPPEYVLGKY